MASKATTRKIESLIPDLWLETVEPWDAETLQQFWDNFASPIPADVAAFYSITDGGEIPKLECCFYGLERAREIAEYVNEQTSMPVLPVFHGSGEASDPVCVLLETGLSGAVVQFCHDGDARVHASSFTDFLLAITEIEEEGFLEAHDHNFCFPKRMTKKEEVLADKLVELSKKDVDPDSACINAEYEPALFAQLAQSMPLSNSGSKYLDPFTYNTGRARNDAAQKLFFEKTPEARAKLAEFCKVMNDFAKELKTALAKEDKKLTLEPAGVAVQTSWIVYRDRRVLVDDVFSAEEGEKRLDPMRKWIEEVDELLETS